MQQKVDENLFALCISILFREKLIELEFGTLFSATISIGGHVVQMFM